MFNKLFGKKNDGFYMQIDETAPPKAESPKTESPKAAPPKSKFFKFGKSKSEGAKTGATPESGTVQAAPLVIVAETSVKPSATITDSASQAIDPAAKDQGEPKAKSAKTSIKKDKKEKKVEEPITSGASEALAVSKASPEPVVPAFTNFATDYLVTPAIAGNRRNPGANMKSFMSMARDVKEMKKGSQGNQQKEKAAKKTEA